jgi:hypothetical protein
LNDGCGEGLNEGKGAGAMLGRQVGLFGFNVGEKLGFSDGCSIEGKKVGLTEGASVGLGVGFG